MCKFDDRCKSCQAIQGLISLTNSPRIYETDHWIIEHVHPTSIEGWLVVVLNRHCSALHELTEEEFTELSQLLRLLCQALHEILNTEKEYVMQFAEGEGFNHVHFHVVARLPVWPESLKGPGVFEGVDETIGTPLTGGVLTSIALKIKDYLLDHLIQPREL